MILLGIDPGIADMGYGVIAAESGRQRCLAYGSVKTPKGVEMPARLAALDEALRGVIERYRPERAAMERLFFSKNVRTAMVVAEARGVIRLCLEKSGIPCREFSPQDVKLAVCGHGAADKVQVQRMVKALLGLVEVPKPDDAADALAMAIALASTREPVLRR